MCTQSSLSPSFDCGVSSLSFTFLVALLPLHFIMLSAPSMNEVLSPVHVRHDSLDTARCQDGEGTVPSLLHVSAKSSTHQRY